MIRSAAGVVIVPTIGVLAYLFGRASTWRRHQRARAQLDAAGDAALERISVLLGGWCRIDDLWHTAVESAALGGLAMVECRFVAGTPPPALSLVGRASGEPRGPIGRVVLPHAGAAIGVSCEGVVVGHLLVVPRPEVAPLSVDRRVLAALADQVALAVTPVREADGRWRATQGE